MKLTKKFFVVLCVGLPAGMVIAMAHAAETSVTTTMELKACAGVDLSMKAAACAAGTHGEKRLRQNNSCLDIECVKDKPATMPMPTCPKPSEEERKGCLSKGGRMEPVAATASVGSCPVFQCVSGSDTPAVQQPIPTNNYESVACKKWWNGKSWMISCDDGTELDLLKIRMQAAGVVPVKEPIRVAPPSASSTPSDPCMDIITRYKAIMTDTTTPAVDKKAVLAELEMNYKTCRGLKTIQMPEPGSAPSSTVDTAAAVNATTAVRGVNAKVEKRPIDYKLVRDANGCMNKIFRDGTVQKGFCAVVKPATTTNVNTNATTTVK